MFDLTESLRLLPAVWHIHSGKNPTLPKGGFCMRQSEFHNALKRYNPSELTSTCGLVSSVMDAYRNETNVPIYVWDNLTIAVIGYRYAWYSLKDHTYHRDTQKIDTKNSRSILDIVAYIAQTVKGADGKPRFIPLFPALIKLDGHVARELYGESTWCRDGGMLRKTGRLVQAGKNLDAWSNGRYTLQNQWVDLCVSYEETVGKRIKRNIYTIDVRPQYYLRLSSPGDTVRAFWPHIMARRVDGKLAAFIRQARQELFQARWWDELWHLSAPKNWK